MLKPGSFVHWRECPSHLEKFSRTQVLEIQDGWMRLGGFSNWISLDQLEAVQPTQIERNRCNAYNSPITGEIV
ncbi:hypothetical protein [Leptolyngbya sp. FACHB-17]|uniref:hypothetical protein n=1 Tax=Leptolyngbya sp. FACHB-17 TaxID=2692803 RepID=UPI0016805CD2|nr:hypothetical protein [Leptolyngbya sp. FACHB-17]MBD2079588.1 hypothetical protein [Leptolyngbya sp. FACHB-17]